MKSLISTMTTACLLFSVCAQADFTYPPSNKVTLNQALDIKFHNHSLSPILWNKENQLKPDMRKKLNAGLNYFIKLYKLDELKLEDAVIMGSMANYDYDRYSDIDVHLFYTLPKESKTNTTLQNALRYINVNWEARHHITINGHTVNYFLDSRTDRLRNHKHDKQINLSFYSLKHNRWIIRPTYTPAPKINLPKVREAYKSAKDQLNDIAMLYNKKRFDQSLNESDKLLRTLTSTRNTALNTEGRYAVANIAYKALRRTGVISDIRKYKSASSDQLLSYESDK